MRSLADRDPSTKDWPPPGQRELWKTFQGLAPLDKSVAVRYPTGAVDRATLQAVDELKRSWFCLRDYRKLFELSCYRLFTFRQDL